MAMQTVAFVSPACMQSKQIRAVTEVAPSNGRAEMPILCVAPQAEVSSEPKDSLCDVTKAGVSIEIFPFLPCLQHFHLQLGLLNSGFHPHRREGAERTSFDLLRPFDHRPLDNSKEYGTEVRSGQGL